MQLEPVLPGTRVHLTDDTAAAPADAPSKESALEQVDTLAARLDELQEALYGEEKRAVLVVLQGRDTSGKDGTIRKVFGPLNPQGVTVTAFKAPTPKSRLRRAYTSRPTVAGLAIAPSVIWLLEGQRWSKIPASVATIRSGKACWPFVPSRRQHPRRGVLPPISRAMLARPDRWPKPTSIQIWSSVNSSRRLALRRNWLRTRWTR